MAEEKPKPKIKVLRRYEKKKLVAPGEYITEDCVYFSIDRKHFLTQCYPKDKATKENINKTAIVFLEELKEAEIEEWELEE